MYTLTLYRYLTLSLSVRLCLSLFAFLLRVVVVVVCICACAPVWMLGTKQLITCLFLASFFFSYIYIALADCFSSSRCPWLCTFLSFLNFLSPFSFRSASASLFFFFICRLCPCLLSSSLYEWTSFRPAKKKKKRKIPEGNSKLPEKKKRREKSTSNSLFFF